MAIPRSVRALGVLLTACLAACSGRSAANQPRPFAPDPNTGTAPDWIMNCINRARSQFGVAQADVRLAEGVMGSGGGYMAEGSAGLGAGVTGRFRCVTDADGRITAVTVLPARSENGQGNMQTKGSGS